MASSRSVMVQIRARPRDVKTWRAAAKRADETLSEWIRNLCNVGAIPSPPSVPSVVSGDQIELPLNDERSRKRASRKRAS